MKQQKRWITLIVVLTLLVLACAPCGLSNLLERTGDVIPSVVEEVEEIAESTAQEAAETTEETGDEQSAESASESTEADQEVVQADEAIVSEGSAAVDAVNLPDNFQDSLANLSSYQMEYHIEAKTTAETVITTILIERTQTALHLVMQNEGDVAQMGGFDRMEIFVVAHDGQTTMYMQNPQDQSWTAITTDDMDDAFGILPFSPNSFASIPEQAQVVGPENVNGIPTIHYAFSEEDFLGTAPGIQEAQGDIWVKESTGDGEMDMIIKAIFSVTGSELSVANQAVQFTSYNMMCEIKKYNDPSIVITLPEAALNSGAITIPGTSTDPDQIDLPMPDDAVIEMSMTGMVNYTTAKSVPEVWQFYQEVFGPASNWQVTSDTQTSVMASINSSQFIIVAEGDLTRVIVNSQ